MKFLIVAAKTGGHVFPAASIAKGLIKKDHKVVFLGTGAQIEKNAFKDIPSTSFNLSIEGFRGKNLIKKCKVLSQVLINVFKILSRNTNLRSVAPKQLRSIAIAKMIGIFPTH